MSPCLGFSDQTRCVRISRAREGLLGKKVRRLQIANEGSGELQKTNGTAGARTKRQNKKQRVSQPHLVATPPSPYLPFLLTLAAQVASHLWALSANCLGSCQHGNSAKRITRQMTACLHMGRLSAPRVCAIQRLRHWSTCTSRTRSRNSPAKCWLLR